MKFLEEFNLKFGTENCYVRFNNKILIKSRDNYYYFNMKN